MRLLWWARGVAASVLGLVVMLALAGFATHPAEAGTGVGEGGTGDGGTTSGARGLSESAGFVRRTVGGDQLVLSIDGHHEDVHLLGVRVPACEIRRATADLAHAAYPDAAADVEEAPAVGRWARVLVDDQDVVLPGLEDGALKLTHYPDQVRALGAVETTYRAAQKRARAARRGMWAGNC